MARTQATAQMHGLPRERSSRQRNLKYDLRRKIHILRIEAPFGIIGVPGSGRKTLGYRFANMNRDVIQEGEVPVAYFYTAFFGARFSPQLRNNPYGRFTLRLTAYIIDPPVELPLQDPPLYWRHWNDFCCLVFAFDVRNQTSFREVSLRLTGYRQENYRVPVCYIAGNKSDRRHEPPSRPVNLDDPEYLNQRPVCERTAYMEAEHLGAFYLECSAKNNTEVSVLLNFIKMCAIDRKYFLPGN
ncbi:hypothetical protein AVEN_220054-1 [Araneus ventricosus]|uniref:Ras-like protein family member 10B n=1 Tax=Araneus ventricosus TaxID=182803 RepID=A0A4Y2CQA4_ARAVE|nr:hypothetical protein AVEN_220054-1 [Araneus ventricosus]